MGIHADDLNHFHLYELLKCVSTTAGNFEAEVRTHLSSRFSREVDAGGGYAIVSSDVDYREFATYFING